MMFEFRSREPRWRGEVCIHV